MWERVEKRGIERRALRQGPGDRPRPDLPAGHGPAPRDQAHRGADDGEPLLRQLPRHARRAAATGCPLGAGGTPTAATSCPTGSASRAITCRPRAQVPGNPTQTWHASHISVRRRHAAAGSRRSVWDTVPGGDPAVPMGYWTEADLPFYHGLARTFPVADRWFCSCLGPTFPNRRFLIAGTAHGLIDDLPWDLVDYPPAGTIFDALTSHGISWVNYHNVHPALVVLKRLLGGRGLVAAAAAARSSAGGCRGWRTRSAATSRSPPTCTRSGSRGAVRHLRTTHAVLRRRRRRDAARGVASWTRTSAPTRRRTRRTSRRRGVRRRGGQRGHARARAGSRRCCSGSTTSTAATTTTCRRRPRSRRTTCPRGTGSCRTPWAAHAAAAARRRSRSRRLENADDGPVTLRPLRVPRPRGDRLPLRAAGLRAARRARPHLGAQAHRGEVEPAAAHPPGRRRASRRSARSTSTRRPRS